MALFIWYCNILGMLKDTKILAIFMSKFWLTSVTSVLMYIDFGLLHYSALYDLIVNYQHRMG